MINRTERRDVDTQAKLELLGRSAQYDLCGSCCGKQAPRVREDATRWIYPAVLPDGKRVKLLKVLMTNACKNDCAYCGVRRSRDFQRSEFEPAELARLFYEMKKARLVTGLFLSSGVKGDADRTMAKMLATAELLRKKYEFDGYIHMKVLPGASFSATEAAAQLADRVSVNLEAPNESRLSRIAPDKDFRKSIFARMQWISDLVRNGATRANSHTTQFVVGAAGESDAEILDCVNTLYRRYSLNRAYYSAYQRPDDAAPCDAPSVPLMREHRLYQADWLMRKYQFRKEELALDESGNLSLVEDPKTIWARRHPERFPIEINRALLHELLRVPGIGPTSAKRICEARLQTSLRSLTDLKRLGAIASRAASYVTIGGRRFHGAEQREFLWS